MKKEEIHQGDGLIFSTSPDSSVTERYRGRKCKVIAVDVTDGKWRVNVEYTSILSGENARIWGSNPNDFERPLCKENECLDAMFAEF